MHMKLKLVVHKGNTRNIITQKEERDKTMLSFEKRKKKYNRFGRFSDQKLHFSWQERKENLAEIYMWETLRKKNKKK